VDVLHEDVETLIEQARELANTDTESALESRLEESFARYKELWDHRADVAIDGKDRIPAALKILTAETLPQAGQLRQYNTHQIDESEAAMRRTIKWIAWALVGVGCVGSLAGVLFGYAVARTLRRSIYQLSVRIRDAADKLREELPTVTITRGAGI